MTPEKTAPLNPEGQPKKTVYEWLGLEEDLDPGKAPTPRKSEKHNTLPVSSLADGGADEGYNLNPVDDKS